MRDFEFFNKKMQGHINFNILPQFFASTRTFPSGQEHSGSYIFSLLGLQISEHPAFRRPSYLSLQGFIRGPAKKIISIHKLSNDKVWIR